MISTAVRANDFPQERQMTGINTAREANIALATKLMSDFGRNMEGWYDNLHADIVLEFPFGASVGMPTRVAGKAAASALFAATVASVRVRFHDVVIYPTVEPHRLVVEYKGYSEPNGKIYAQTYIGIQEYLDGKLILFKEYWDAVIVDRTFGDLSALGT
jgi:ketosteroid isomerase-like protein